MATPTILPIIAPIAILGMKSPEWKFLTGRDAAVDVTASRVVFKATTRPITPEAIGNIMNARCDTAPASR